MFIFGKTKRLNSERAWKPLASEVVVDLAVVKSVIPGAGSGDETLPSRSRTPHIDLHRLERQRGFGSIAHRSTSP